MTFARARIPENKASLLPTLPPPAWVYLHGVKSDLSSTALREAKGRDLKRDLERDLERDDG
jgi:nicotinate-nucleotide adenylyltransferase